MTGPSSTPRGEHTPRPAPEPGHPTRHQPAEGAAVTTSTRRRVPALHPTERAWAILKRCYRGQPPADVLERALVMLATADGHLDTAGRIKDRRRA